MSKDKGYILVWRDIFDDDIWCNDKPKDIFSAWIYLIAHANYQPSNVYSRQLARGQHWTSITSLASTWHIDKRKVKDYLGMLAQDGKITWEIFPKGVLITIVNYDKYQSLKKGN